MSDLLRGLDISAYQGTEDLASLDVVHDLDFIICRAWQSNSQRDPRFPDYWRQLAPLDIVRGAYGFAHSGTSPVKSADGLVDYVLELGTRPTDLLVLDLESNLGNLSAPDLAAWAIAWAKRVTTRCPDFKPVYYGGYPVHVQYKDFPKYFSAWWWARYPAALSQRTAWPRQMLSPGPNYWPGGPHIWQFSQDYPIGPNDPHDANVSSLTREQLRSLNPGADMPLTPQEKTDIAKAAAVEVWKATFGEADGATVANMLQRAYHDADDAQRAVDTLVGKVDALAGKVDGIAAPAVTVTVDPAQLEAAVEAVLRRVTLGPSA